MKFNFLFILLLILSGNLKAQDYLRADGKRIVNGNNENIILRGIGTGNWMLMEGYMMKTQGIAGTQHEIRQKIENLIGTEKTDSFFTIWLENHFTSTDVDSMKAWGFNSVRVAMHYKWFTLPIEEEPVAGQNTWINKGFIMIDSLLDWCSDNEMYLILDLHAAPGGQGTNADISDYDPSKPSLWQSQENKNKTIALWHKLAERYSTEKWIGGYDILNETNWSFPEGNNSQMRELFGNITSSIREVDTNHIIFIEGNSYANDFSGLTPPWDNNLVYSFHKYWSGTGANDLDWILSLRDTYNVPLWLGESGENSNTWYTDLISLCENNNIGWSWWPVKKNGLNNVLSVKLNKEYEDLVKYWRGEITTAPTEYAAFYAIQKWSDNHRIENCIVQYDVIDAMIRQPHSDETKPYRNHKLEQPIFFSDYDYGKNGFAYYDKDVAYYGGAWTDWNAGWSLRSDGVDIEPCQDNSDTTNGYNVGWTENDEWMQYSLTTDSIAAYTLSVRSASGEGGSSFQIAVNNINVTDILKLPATGGWQKWVTTTFENIIIPAGDIKIKFINVQEGSNLSYFKFHSPISADSIDFNLISAETSTDGYKVYLTLNKEVTTSDADINLNHFELFKDGIKINLTDINTDSESNKFLILSHETKIFSNNVITVSYNGTSVQSGIQFLTNFTNIPVHNNLEISHNIPGIIQAEDYYLASGLALEACEDIGGGQNTGYANSGDYLVYKVNVTNSGYYKVNYRVATIRSNAELIFQVGDENEYTSLNTMKFTNTGGWQSWETQSSSSIYLEEGHHNVRLYIKQSEHNLNWFELEIATGLGILKNENPKISVYPNPVHEIVFLKINRQNDSSKIRVSLVSSSGQVLENLIITENDSQINIAKYPKGIYFIVVKTNNETITQPIVIY